MSASRLAAVLPAVFFAGCATFATIDPKSTEAAIKKACSEETTDPAEYRDNTEGGWDAVRFKSYRGVVQANLDCEKQLAATALFNEDAAKKNAAQVWAGGEQGAGLTLGGMLLIALLVLLH